MTGGIRLTAVLTHPIQSYAPWFRHIAEHCPQIDLTVLYATEPTPAQQGVGFGQAFQSDVALTEGYRFHVVRFANESASVHSSDYRGIDVSEILDATEETHADVALILDRYWITVRRALRHRPRQGIPTPYRGDTNLSNALMGWND